MLFAAAAATIGASAQEVLRSPDGELELRFSLSDKGEPTYALDYKGRAVVLPSRMGLELRGDAPALEFGAEIQKGGYGEPVSLYDGFEQCGACAASSTRRGSPSGARSRRSATATTSWP